MSKGRRILPVIYDDDLNPSGDLDLSFVSGALTIDVLNSAHVHGAADTLAELLDLQNRANDRSTIHAPFQIKFKRHLDYRKPHERRQRDEEIEKRIGHPTFGLLRDAWGAFHTEVLTRDLAKPGAVKRVRKELAHVLAMAKRLDAALASAVAKDAALAKAAGPRNRQGPRSSRVSE